MRINLLSSLFLGSSLAKLVTHYLVDYLKINLFNNSSDIPGWTEELSAGKTYDLLEFSLILVFIPISFLIIQRFFGKKHLLKYTALILNIFVFIQIFFTTFSVVAVSVIVVLFYLIFLIWNYLPINGSKSKDIILIYNGFLTAFYLAILLGNFVTSIVPFAIFIIIPLVYYTYGGHFGNFSKSHFHLLFGLSFIAPVNLAFLSILGIISTFLIVVFKDRFNKLNGVKYIYPSVLLFLVTYNPIYYLSPFDSVEEGFWAAWIQRIKNGEILYRDVAVYHPPFIVWFLYHIQNLTGFTLQNMRLGLHLLQISGVVIYYFLMKCFVEKPISRVVVMVLALSLTTLIIKNNIEIRLAFGLLSLIMLRNYLSKNNYKFLVLAGVFSGISILTSVEVGVAAILSSLISIIVFNKNLKSIVIYLSGLTFIVLVFTLYFLSKGAIYDLINQISYYTSSFSRGYLNLVIPKPSLSSIVYVHLVGKYFYSIDILWEIAKWGITASGIFSIYRIINKKGTLTDKTVLIFVIFSIILFRAALGRSDYYHLLFPLLVVIPLIFYLAEKLYIKNNNALFLLTFLFLTVFLRDFVTTNFLQHQALKIQMYGRNTDFVSPFISQEKTELVNFIRSNTTPQQKIFVYPWMPELYYLADRQNATRIDTPYSFFTDNWQEEMIKDLSVNNPKYVVYEPNMSFANLGVSSLPKLNDYILTHYEESTNIGPYKLLIKKQI